jgi:hypothetical protein
LAVRAAAKGRADVREVTVFSAMSGLVYKRIEREHLRGGRTNTWRRVIVEAPS